MPSSYGKRHGLIGYDEFRTGLTYHEVWEMLRNDDDDSKVWRYKSRGVILGMWHELKMQLYQQYLDAYEGGQYGSNGKG
jgi:hypothetical protein